MNDLYRMTNDFVLLRLVILDSELLAYILVRFPSALVVCINDFLTRTNEKIYRRILYVDKQPRTMIADSAAECSTNPVILCSHNNQYWQSIKANVLSFPNLYEIADQGFSTAGEILRRRKKGKIHVLHIV